MKTYIRINGKDTDAPFAGLLVRIIGFIFIVLVIALLAVVIIPLIGIAIIGYLCVKVVQSFFAIESESEKGDADEFIVSQGNSAPEEAKTIPCETIEEESKTNTYSSRSRMR